MDTSQSEIGNGSGDVQQKTQTNLRDQDRHYSRCGELQGKVANVYKEIKEIIRMPGYDTHIRRNIRDFEKVDVPSLEKRENDLSNTDCPIVIAGETSSGKSTVINLLISDHPVLPTKITPSTTKICRIRRNENCSITAYGGNENYLQTWKVNDLNDMADKLENLACEEDTETTFLDILMPAQMIQGNVIIVDTPGIGDEDQDQTTKMMMDYLKNAIAVVFVVNVANAGGMQKDRLCRIVTSLRNSMDRTMSCFSPKDTIFVLNKWDSIARDKKREEFFNLTKARIQTDWKEITEGHVLKLAATEASSSKEYGDMLREFKTTLKKVIEKNENKRIESHLEFLHLFLENCQTVASAKLKETNGEIKTIFEEIDDMKAEEEDLKKLMKKGNDDLSSLIDKFLSHATESFCDYLNSEHFRNEMFKEIDKCTRFSVEEKLASCIDTAVNEWEKTQIENIVLKVIKTEFGEKFFNACKKENALLRKELEDLAHDSWFTTIIKHFPYKLIAAGVGLTTRSVMGAGVIGAMTVGGYTLSFLSKARHSFESTRDDTFKLHIEALIKDNDKQIRNRYEPTITKFIKSVIKNDLMEKELDVEKSIRTKMDNHYKMHENSSKLIKIESAITKARHSLEYILNRPTS